MADHRPHSPLDGPLTAEQVTQFEARGFVRLEGAAPLPFLEAWLEHMGHLVASNPARFVREHAEPHLWGRLGGYARERPDTWPRGRLTVSGAKSWSFPDVLPEVWAAVAQLMGGEDRVVHRRLSDFVIADHRHDATPLPAGAPEPVVTRPEPPQDHPFHLDDPQKASRLRGYPNGLVLVVLLTDVAEGEGGTVLAADSIGPIAELMRAHPAGVDLTDNGRIQALSDRFRDLVELTGRAGDVYITHALAAHAPGPAWRPRRTAVPWLRALSNPTLRLRGGLRLDLPMDAQAPVERAVSLALGGPLEPLADDAVGPPQPAPAVPLQPQKPPKAAPTLRPFLAPSWLTDALATLADIAFIGATDEGLSLRLRPTGAGAGEPLTVELVAVPADSKRHWVWRSGRVGLRYRSEHTHEGIAAFVQGLGRALAARVGALEALVEAAPRLARVEGDRLDALLARAWANDPDVPFEARELAQELAAAPGGLTAPDADALALLMAARSEPADVLRLADAVAAPGPVLRVLGHLLRGERAEGLEALAALPDAAGGAWLVSQSASDLAALLGAHEVPLAWAERAHRTRVGPRARARAGILLAERLQMARGLAAGERIEALLTDALERLGQDPDAIDHVAMAAVAARRYALAEAALKQLLRLERRPKAFADLADLLLWRGDTARARTCCERALATPDLTPEARRPEDRRLAHRLRGTLAACDVLDGPSAAGFPAAVPALREVAEATGETLWWLWHGEGILKRDGPVPAAAEAMERGTRGRHWLSASVLKALAYASAEAEPLRSLIVTGGLRSFDALYDGRLDAVVPREDVVAAYGSGEAALAILRRALKAFGGNRTTQPSFVDGDGRLQPIDDAGSPRMAVSDAVSTVRVRRADDVLAAATAVMERFPSYPEPPCYRGELLLWMGRLGDAMASFERAHLTWVTRWAFIGQGAVHALEGRHDAALERFDACERIVGPLEGATLVVYRGESARRAGDLHRALRDLEEAVGAKASRVGAWANLALTRKALGDLHGAQEALAQVWARVPHVLRLASRLELGRVWEEPELQTAEPVLERYLALSAGNRSSHLWTFVCPDTGELRVLADPAVLRTWAQKFLEVGRLLRPVAAPDTVDGPRDLG